MDDRCTDLVDITCNSHQHTGCMIVMVADSHEHDLCVCNELYKVNLQVKLQVKSHWYVTEQF